MAVSWGGVSVYVGDIKKKYRVIKKLREKRKQISGPNYYDGISGTAWMSAAGGRVGADAVTHYADRRIKGENMFELGYFEAQGTAVKFVK